MAQEKNKPDAVVPGQVWQDFDERTRNDEFTVEAVVHTDRTVDYLSDPMPEDVQAVVNDVLRNARPVVYAVIRRRPAGILRVVSAARLLETDATRGYRYLGKDR